VRKVRVFVRRGDRRLQAGDNDLETVLEPGFGVGFDQVRTGLGDERKPLLVNDFGQLAGPVRVLAWVRRTAAGLLLDREADGVVVEHREPRVASRIENPGVDQGGQGQLKGPGQFGLGNVAAGEHAGTVAVVEHRPGEACGPGQPPAPARPSAAPGLRWNLRRNWTKPDPLPPTFRGAVRVRDFVDVDAVVQNCRVP
jgi:hypothetical protein